MKNYSNQVFLMLALALLGMSAYAVTYDQYPLGVYSYLCTQAFDEDEIEQSISLIKDMGYNIVQITNHRSSNPLGNILAMLQNDSLYAIVADLDYPVSNPTNYNNYNTTALTTSSYLKFEAEFSGSDDIDFGKEDMNWYCSHDESYEPEGIPITFPRVGFSELVPNSNESYWRCNRNVTDPGYAYTDIRWRWLKNGLAENKRLGDEFYIYHDQRGESDTPSSNQSRYLYIRFKVRLENFTPSITGITPLLSFTTRGETANGTVYVNHSCDYDPASYITTTFYYDDYVAFGSPTGYFDIEIKISYADLLSLNLISAVREFRYVLENLNPWVYWHGNCDLYLDYIEYEDQMHYDMMNDVTGYTTNINNRIDYLQSLNGNDIIKHMYSRCEPKLGQFHSYDRVHTYIANSGVPIPNPNIITAAYDTDHRKIPMPTGKYYDHVRCFMDSVKPEIILPDIYPVKPLTDYNSDDTTNPNAFQTRVDDQLIYQYKQTRLKCNEETPRTTFIPIVQAFGEWRESSWVSWALPPAETIKCLKYLPLCYDPDGIIDFRVTSKLTGPIGSNANGPYCSIMKDNSELILDTNPTREAVIEANEKIGVIGPMIKHDMTWLGGGCLNVGSETADDMLQANLPGKGISSLQVEDPDVEDPDVEDPIEDEYSGYIHCGLYEDNENSEIPYVVLVNRRANYSLIDGYTTQTTPPSEYDSHYISANSQSARFGFSNLAHNTFGTFLAVHDLYNGDLFEEEDNVASVIIDPGDCRLVEICGTLPDTVTTETIISQTGVISGEIILEAGADVEIAANTTLLIKKNSHINIMSGASMIIRGNVKIEEGADFYLCDGSLSFIDSFCTWETGSSIQVDGGILSIDNTTFEGHNAARWTGIRVTSATSVSIHGSTIKNAVQNQVYNANLTVHNSSFYVPENSGGLMLKTSASGFTTMLSNDQAIYGFFGLSNNSTIGLTILDVNSPVSCDNVLFTNLGTGIYKIRDSYEDAMVLNSLFTNCLEGIKDASSRNYMIIQKCTFINDNFGKGVYALGANPEISDCIFNGCDIGVFKELSSPRSLSYSGIIHNMFNNGNIGVQGRNANGRLFDNVFNHNQTGIANHKSANFNLSYYARNKFMNTVSNISFSYFEPYEATIQLFKGHNDFYHLAQDVVDFCFDQNYYNSILPYSCVIDASSNWFESSTCIVNDPYSNYVYVGMFDPEPNYSEEDNDINRYSQGLAYEADGQYENAYQIYKEILNDKLDSEKRFHLAAADGMFRLSTVVVDPEWETIDYFDSAIIQNQIDDPHLSDLLKDYLARLFVYDKDYQSAIDLIQCRIDNPLSEIDSLRAVLDLEIVLYLADLDDSKKPITTKYTEYKYPDVATFDVKHSEHWDKLYELLNKGSYSIIPIPKYPSITTNFPNPFNPSTTISFSIPGDSKIRMNVYNLRGQMVRKLIDSDFNRGHHQVVWNGKDDGNRSVGSGLYLIRLESQGKVHTRKVMLMK